MRQLACAALFVLLAAPCFAQDPAPEDLGRFHFGPLRFTPSISLSNFGVDDNVFNDPANPQQDTTGAVGPAVDFWMRAGRARISGKSADQYLYFRKFGEQRAWNTDNALRIEFPSARLTPFVSGSYVNTRERSGYEIDSRVRRADYGGAVGTELRLSGKTRLVVSGEQRQMAFDRNETFLGEALAAALDRTTTTERVNLGYALTPLTTWVLTNEVIQDRFRISSDHDANSVRVLSGFELTPFALISGRVVFGVRHFNVLNQNTPDYNGFVAETDAKYAMGATQFSIRYARDVAFSYEPTTPYYVLNDVGLTVTERVTHAWDLVGRVGRQSLAYTQTASSELSNRTDHGTQWGGGIGYRVGETLRLGLDANYYRRQAPAVVGRDYEGLRVGGSVSYGLPQ